MLLPSVLLSASVCCKLHVPESTHPTSTLTRVFAVLLQILWQLLYVRPGVSVIGPRVQEIFKECLQQKEQCPQVFNFLVNFVPGKIAEQLRQSNTAASPTKSLVNCGISVEDQRALNAYQDKRGCVAQQAVAERQGSWRALHGEQQEGLVKQAEIRDVKDLKALLLVRPPHSCTMSCNC